MSVRTQGAISNEVGLACPDAVIKSFEPQSELAPLVAVSASLNDIDRIEVFPVAVGDHDGVVKLHKPAHALHASLMSSGEVGESTVDCPLVTLDNLVASGQLPAPFVYQGRCRGRRAWRTERRADDLKAASAGGNIRSER